MTILSDSSCEVPAAPAVSRGSLVEWLRDWVSERLPGSALLSIVDQAVVSGTSFATAVVVGRLCSREDLGVYSLALSVLLFCRGVLVQLVCAPYTVLRARRNAGEAEAVHTGSALVHYLALSALSTVGLVVVASLASLGVGPFRGGGAMWVLAGVAPFLFFREYVRQLALALLSLRTALIIDVTVAVIQIGGVLLSGRLGAISVATAFGVSGTACAVVCIGWLWARPVGIRIVIPQVPADWRRNWSFARWTLASFLVGNTAVYIMPYIVVMAHGTAEAGLLAACSSVIAVAGMFVMGVDNLLTPQAARAYASGGLLELRRVLWTTAVLFLVTLGSFCLVMFVAGDLPTTLVYGSRYAGAGPVLAILSVHMLINSFGVTVGNGLWAIEHPEANFLADISCFTLTIGAALCLVPALGLIGVAVATLLGGCTGVTVRCVQFMRFTRGQLQSQAV
jgi:O-antigen/teichoic acid export membrane protein